MNRTRLAVLGGVGGDSVDGDAVAGQLGDPRPRTAGDDRRAPAGGLGLAAAGLGDGSEGQELAG